MSGPVPLASRLGESGLTLLCLASRLSPMEVELVRLGIASILASLLYGLSRLADAMRERTQHPLPTPLL